MHLLMTACAAAPTRDIAAAHLSIDDNSREEVSFRGNA